MKRVCAWCNTSLGTIESDLHHESAITHGICDSCLNKIFANKTIDFLPFLNSITAPVVLIDENNTYLSANDIALDYLGAEHKDLNSKRTGDVFKCQNAHLPGGCGQTDQCGGCQMRQLITDTYIGKDKFEHVPVTLIQKHGETRKRIDLELTTEKVNGLVLLRIDDHS